MIFCGNRQHATDDDFYVSHSGNINLSWNIPSDDYSGDANEEQNRVLVQTVRDINETVLLTLL